MNPIWRTMNAVYKNKFRKWTSCILDIEEKKQENNRVGDILPWKLSYQCCFVGQNCAWILCTLCGTWHEADGRRPKDLGLTYIKSFKLALKKAVKLSFSSLLEFTVYETSRRYIFGFSKWSFINSYYQLWQVIVTSKKLIIVPHGVLKLWRLFL